jgi:hypothetical protein
LGSQLFLGRTDQLRGHLNANQKIMPWHQSFVG